MIKMPIDDLLKIDPERLDSDNRGGLIQQLEQLTAYVRAVSRELAALGPSQMRNSHIPHATDQLGAVVEATEEAANQIMDACDTLQTVGNEIGGDHAQRIGNAVTTIYEACGFQDLTGQRIVTVRQTLGIIETKLGDLMQMLGIPADMHQDPADDEADLTVDQSSMLNGPQLPSNAIDQSAIDALMADM